MMSANRSRLLAAAACALALLLVIGVLVMREAKPAPKAARPAAAAAPARTPADGKAIAAHPAAPSNPARPARATAPAKPKPKSQPATSESPKTLVAYHGRVTAEADGSPIAGAEVCVVDVLAGAESCRVSTHTDADGKYRLEATSSGAFEALLARAEGFASRMGGGQFGGGRAPGADPQEVDFVLFAGGEIAGSVRDEDGNPIAGATVGSPMLLPDLKGDWSAVGSPDADALVVSAVATTGTDGGFVLRGLRADRKYRVPARADDFIPGSSEPVDVGASDVAITLKRGGARVHGVVVEADGAPVPDVMVSIVQYGEMVARSAVPVPLSVKCDARGAFAMGGLAPGSTMLMVQSVDPASAAPPRSARADVVLESGKDAEVRIVFEAATVIAGRVVDADTEEGVAGVVVRVAPGGGDWAPDETPGEGEIAGGMAAITDASGAFRLSTQMFTMSDMEPGVSIRPNSPWVCVGPRSRTLAKGSTEDVVFRVRRGILITGTVLLADGATPAEGARVRFREESTGMGGPPGRGPSSIADAAGAFTIGVSPGAVGAVVAEHDGGMAATRKITIPRSGTLPPVTLVLASYGTIAGKVLDASDEPIAGATIMISETKEGRYGMSSPPARTDAEGAFRFEKCAPGKYSLRCHMSSQGGAAPPPPQEVELQAGETRDDIVFKPPAGVEVEGVVTDKEGKPLENASVTAIVGEPRFEQPGVATARTDKAGYFLLTGMPPGRPIAGLTASHDGYKSQSLDGVMPSAEPLVFALDKLEPVTVVAVDAASDAPVTAYRLKVLLDQGAGFYRDMRSGSGDRDVADPQGRAILDTIELNEYTAYRFEATELDAPGGAPTGRVGAAELPRANDGSASHAVTIKVAAGRRIAGVVVSAPDGAPVAGATVRIQGLDFDFGKRATNTVETDASGRFAFEQKTAGTFPLRAEKDGRKSRLVSAEVTADTDAEVRLELAIGASIHGYVIGIDGAPAAGVGIRVLTAEQRDGFYDYLAGRATTDAQGAYRIDNLPPVACNVSREDDRRAAGRQLTLADGDDIEVNFDDSGQVAVSGSIVINGVPVAADNWPSLRSADNANFLDLKLDDSGHYSGALLPATYSVFLHGSTADFMVVLDDAWAVEAEPKEQVRDFRLELPTLDLVVDPPEGRSLGAGRVTFEEKGSRMQNWFGIASPTMHFPYAPEGEYRAVVDMTNGLRGTSEWTPIRPGLENTIRVTLADGAATTD